jgi:hypothetical protein
MELRSSIGNDLKAIGELAFTAPLHENCMNPV